jgi:hypothetical protein
MYLKKINKSSVRHFAYGVLKFLAFVLFIYCFYQACKITTP